MKGIDFRAKHFEPWIRGPESILRLVNHSIADYQSPGHSAVSSPGSDLRPSQPKQTGHAW